MHDRTEIGQSFKMIFRLAAWGITVRVRRQMNWGTGL